MKAVTRIVYQVRFMPARSIVEGTAGHSFVSRRENVEINVVILHLIGIGDRVGIGISNAWFCVCTLEAH